VNDGLGMADRFHKAARDGYLDALREATRRDCNSKDEDGMTPTLWAAFEGNLEALRLLVGRGGDPEKCDNYGNTGLHLSAAKGHLNCVTFLINFGVNIWDLDIDLHSAKDLAAINSREDILKYLDAAGAQQEAANSKQAKSLQEKAKKEAEKRVKNFQKIQKKQDKVAAKENETIEKRRMSLHPTSGQIQDQAPPSNIERRASLGVAALEKLGGTLGVRRASQVASAVNHQGASFSDMVGGTVSSRRARGGGGVFNKLQKRNGNGGRGDEFTVREGGGTVRSLAGLRSGQVSEIMFVDKERSGEGGSLGRAAPLMKVFGENGEEQEAKDEIITEPSSIFNRPGFGSVAFRNSISAFNAMSIHNQEEGDSIGSAGSLAQPRSVPEVWGEEGELSDSSEEDNAEYTSLTMFLAAIGLHDWAPKFIRERIDLEALMLLSETDLGEVLGMQMGPRKKLLKAVDERRRAMEEPDEEISDSRL